MSGRKEHRGVWVPPEVFILQEAGELNAVDILLFALINALSQNEKGCYASNEYLANRMGKSASTISRGIARLKGLGLVRETLFNGRVRYLQTTPKPPKKDDGAYAKMPRQHTQKCVPESITFGNTTMSAPKNGADGVGFGVAKIKPSNATEFDHIAAQTLLDATRKYLGPTHPNVKRAKVLSWAHQFCHLRKIDEVPKHKIDKVLGWYVRHMGEEFVPQAFSGETFRRKFHAISNARERDMHVDVITPEAEAIAERLARLNWPKGAASLAPAAITLSLSNYHGWRRALVAYGQIIGDLDIPQRYKRYVNHLCQIAPPADHFIYAWFCQIHKDVCGWDDWDGTFKAFVFRADSKKFCALGKAWTQGYGLKPDAWDELMDELKAYL